MKVNIENMKKRSRIQEAVHDDTDAIPKNKKKHARNESGNHDDGAAAIIQNDDRTKKQTDVDVLNAKDRSMLDPSKRVLPPINYILAPMVGASDLPFRLLCRKYGAQTCYTPMMSSTTFAENPSAAGFTTIMPADRPLTIHVSANNPKDFARAAVQAENIGADAIDLNLGCPQRTAYLGHFGSYLLDEEDRNLVLSMIRAASRATQLPVCVKIRLLDTLPRTIDLCRQLCEAGANLIAIHARKRASWERSSAGARNGPADLTQVQEIRKIIGKEFAHVAVITNGNTITFQDVCDNLCLTGALGLMSAEGILDNPALFLPRLGSREEREKEVTVWTLCKSTEDEKRQHKIDKLYRKLGEIELLEKKERHLLTEKERRKLSRKEKRREKLKKLETKVSTSTMKQTTASLGSLYDQADDKLQLAIEYIDLAITFPVKIRTVIFHVRRMIKDFLIQYQLMDECLNCESVYQVQALLRKIQYYRKHPSSFVFDSEKARQEKYALERKRREDGKRKAYEERMIRKAKREGKSDLNFYLKIGAELPTRELIHEFRAMPRERVISLWKERHSQHCLSFHLDSCQRGRSCAFLHIEIAGDNSFIEKEEVAG